MGQGGSGGRTATDAGPSPADVPPADVAVRVLSAIGTDPTQAFVLLDAEARPRWASPSLGSVFDVDLTSPDPFFDALHPNDADLVAEIFRTEQDGRPDPSFDPERRFELLVRLRAPCGAWRWVALRLHNRIDDPVVGGMVFQLTVANQERSTVEAFDAAALGEPTEQVLGLVLETLRSGGIGDRQAAVFDRDGTCLAATSGAGIAAGTAEDGVGWLRTHEGRVDQVVPVAGPSGATLGTLVTVSDFPEVRPFTRSLTVAVARRVGLVLEARLTWTELERRAVSDPLTGLANRRRLFEHLERDDLGAHVAVALVDLDGFKAINDGLGHAAGDDVLVEVARRLRTLAWPGDLLARLGGDEFVLVRHGDDGALLCREEIAAAVAGAVRTGGGVVDVAVSVGVACGPAARRAELLAEADGAMYASKPGRRAGGTGRSVRGDRDPGRAGRGPR